jgi:hypothetical protein
MFTAPYHQQQQCVLKFRRTNFPNGEQEFYTRGAQKPPPPRTHITINVDGLEVAQSVERQSGQFAL